MAACDVSDVVAATSAAAAGGEAGREASADDTISPQRQADASAAVNEFRELVDGVQPPANADNDAAVGDEALLPEIERLKAEQKRIRLERKRVAKDLKNAEKRRSRLKKKAKQLSDSRRRVTPHPAVQVLCGMSSFPQSCCDHNMLAPCEAKGTVMYIAFR